MAPWLGVYSSIGACIGCFSFQGILLGMLPLVLADNGLTAHSIILAGGNIALHSLTILDGFLDLLG